MIRKWGPSKMDRPCITYRIAPSKDKSIAQRGRTPPTSSIRQMSKRVKSKQLRMMARGTLAFGAATERAASPLPSPGQPGGGREEGPAVPRGPPDREAGAIDCFLHHKAMVKSKHVKAKRDVRTNRSVGGGFLLSVCVTVQRSN